MRRADIQLLVTNVIMAVWKYWVAMKMVYMQDVKGVEILVGIIIKNQQVIFVN